MSLIDWAFAHWHWAWTLFWAGIGVVFVWAMATPDWFHRKDGP